MAQVSGLPAGAARERTAETLRHVGLFEERYREMRGYSTGMKQRSTLFMDSVHSGQRSTSFMTAHTRSGEALMSIVRSMWMGMARF
jgi:hypothetical protein